MALGSNPSPADVVAELYASFPYTFPDAASRWLADVGTTSSITFPTSFANKMSVKIEDHVLPSFSNSFSFTASYGPVFTGRRVILIIWADNDATEISNVRMNGAAASGYYQGYAPGASNSIVTGIYMGNPSGTSGTVSYSLNGVASSRVAVISVIGQSTFVDHDGVTSADWGSMSVSGASNGLLVSSFIRVGGGSNITMSGITERYETSWTSRNTRIGFGFDNRISSSNKSVSINNPDSGNPICALTVCIT